MNIAYKLFRALRLLTIFATIMVVIPSAIMVFYGNSLTFTDFQELTRGFWDKSLYTTIAVLVIYTVTSGIAKLIKNKRNQIADV
jgi:hypothetical protein